ncbi:MAG: BON domain-containing protein [Moraxellaceae bacterium]
MNARHLMIPAVIAAAFAATPVLAADDTYLRQDPLAPSASQSQQAPAPVSVKVDDSSISSQVEAAVANDSIKAKAKEGVVTLKGKVDSRESADAAIQRASTVPGVVSVKSELKIKS